MLDYQNNLIKDMMQTLSEHSFNGVYICDDEGIIYVNNGFATLFGYSRDDFLSHNITFREIIIPEHYDTLVQITDRIMNGEKASDRFKMTGLKKNGELIYLNFIVTADIHLHKQIIVGSIVDKSAEVKLEERLKQAMRFDVKEHDVDAVYWAAYYDHVTRLPNRRMFVERLEAQLKAMPESSIAMLLIDVKKFKLINNSLGHHVGEQVIVQLADRLQHVISAEQMLYRIAGDKFCIVQLQLDDKQAMLSLADRVFEVCRDEFIINGYKLNIEVNIGLSMAPQDGDTIDRLFRAAETALYFAESQTKNETKLYTSSLSVQAFKIFSLNNDLPKALETGQFFLQYMPRIDTQSTQIIGTEALIRWRHPQWGVVPPNEFIPLAEQSGLIEQIGEWVLREACRQNKQWLEQGYKPLRIAVNFSAQQLMQPNLLAIIDQILEETGMPSQLLEIELTESILVSNESDTATLLAELDKRQIKVSLDDFGTGYSSLYSLKQLKVHSLKIDRSFIHDLFSNSVNQSIIQNIISLANDLGLKTVAEGVETIEQYHFMKNLHCEEIQGYYFSRPLDPEQLVTLLSLPFLPHDKERKVQHAHENKRKHFRIEFTSPIVAEMTLSMFNNEQVSLGKTEVFVKNICAGGLNFQMGLKLPVNENMIFEFTVRLMGQTYHFQGKIMWYNELVPGEIYEYGVQFIRK